MIFFIKVGSNKNVNFLEILNIIDKKEIVVLVFVLVMDEDKIKESFEV